MAGTGYNPSSDICCEATLSMKENRTLLYRWILIVSMTQFLRNMKTNIRVKGVIENQDLKRFRCIGYLKVYFEKLIKMFTEDKLLIYDQP